MADDTIKFPATCDAHWASGPVPCCERHAKEIVTLGKFMGVHVPLTKLLEPAECTNCCNEASQP